jgi:hypothetical protein
MATKPKDKPANTVPQPRWLCCRFRHWLLAYRWNCGTGRRQNVPQWLMISRPVVTQWRSQLYLSPKHALGCFENHRLMGQVQDVSGERFS